MVLTERLHRLMERHRQGKLNGWRNAGYYAAGAVLGYHLLFGLAKQLSYRYFAAFSFPSRSLQRRQAAPAPRLRQRRTDRSHRRSHAEARLRPAAPARSIGCFPHATRHDGCGWAAPRV